MAYELSLEERNVENGRVVVNELKHVHLQSYAVVKFCLSSMKLKFSQVLGEEGVQLDK